MAKVATLFLVCVVFNGKGVYSLPKVSKQKDNVNAEETKYVWGDDEDAQASRDIQSGSGDGPTQPRNKTVIPEINLRVDLQVNISTERYYGYVVALPSGGALLVDWGPHPDKIIQLNARGEVAPAVFTCRASGWIHGMILDGAAVYVIQNGGVISLTHVDNLNKIKKEWFIPRIGYVWPGAIMDSTLFLVDYHGGDVFSYNSITKKTRILTKWLDLPQDLTMVPGKANEPFFVVSEFNPMHVNIFDSRWKLRHVIKARDWLEDRNKRDNANKVIATPWGTIFVAYFESNRVAEFSMDGGYVRDVLTAEDGIYGPFCMSIQDPYLWVVHEFKYRHYGSPKTLVKRFKITRL